MSQRQYERHGFNFLAVMVSKNVPLRQYCDVQCCNNERSILLKASDKNLYVIGAKSALFPGPSFRYYGMNVKRVKPAEISPEIRRTCIVFEPPFYTIYPQGKMNYTIDTLVTFII